MTKGGPLGHTSVPVFYIYKLAFTSQYGFSAAGYAAALAYVLFLVHPAADAHPVLARQPGGALLLMSASTFATLTGETGMVERPRRSWLPFSPWHFLLMPVAIVMLLPLRVGRDDVARDAGADPALPADPVAGLVPVVELPARVVVGRRSAGGSGTRRRDDGRRRVEPAAVLARGVRVRPDPVLGQERRLLLPARDADGAAAGRAHPDVPDREADAPARHARRARSCRTSPTCSGSSCSPSSSERCRSSSRRRRGSTALRGSRSCSRSCCRCRCRRSRRWR